MARRSSFLGSLEHAARVAVRVQREREAAERRRHRDQARQQRENLRLQHVRDRLRAQQHYISRQDEAQGVTADIAAQVATLRSILAARIHPTRDSVFASLAYRDEPPILLIGPQLERSQPEPQLDAYLRFVRPLKWWESLVGSRSRFEQETTSAEQQFRTDHSRWEDEERERLAQVATRRHEHDEQLAAHWIRVEQRHREVLELRAQCDANSQEAVTTFFEIVLEQSSWPDDFPHEYRVAYDPGAKQLIIDYELPGVDVIPSVAEYRYVKTKDVIEEKPRKPTEIKELYRDLVSAVTLRCIDECFASAGHQLEVLTFSGFVNTIDRATGNPCRPYLISVRVARERFDAIVLDQVDARVCLRNLGAQVSPQPAELVPVKPIIEFNMVDRRFIDEKDVVSELDSRPNLMDLTPSEFEGLVGNLFTRMGLETKLTRTSRDGGVDAIAYDTRPILGGKVVIQAKRYKDTVGLSAVRDLYGTMMNEGANKGILVTTSSYGPDAYDFCKDKPVELIDGSGLLYHLEEVGVKARIIFPMDRAAAI